MTKEEAKEAIVRLRIESALYEENNIFKDVVELFEFLLGYIDREYFDKENDK